MKLLEVQSTKDFAESFLNDIFFRMVVNRVLDSAPGFELVRCKDCKHMEKTPYGLRLCHVWDGINGMGDEGYCNYGERKDYDQETGEDHSGIR